MPPEGYTFWDQLMAEQGVGVMWEQDVPLDARPSAASQSPFNVGDVIVGEIVEDEEG